MVKIKILELHKHRNETTFRPYLKAHNLFKDYGIEFTQGDSYDFAWIGQASIVDKKLPLQQSIEKGVNFVSRVKGDYFIFDGQDSPSLIGTYEVFKNSNAKYLLKNSLYKDRSMYKVPSVNGRIHWGVGNYAIPDIDSYVNKIKLSGSNWLSTVNPNWLSYSSPKVNDVCALFGHGKPGINMEYGIDNFLPYNLHRKNAINYISSLNDSIKVDKLKPGERLNTSEYYNRMFNCKIIINPFGFGEMAPRDLEAAMFGCILIKPDMSHIESIPMIFEENITYIPVKWNFEDLEEKIDYILNNFNFLQKELVENFRLRYEQLYNPKKIVEHIYNLIFPSNFHKISNGIKLIN